MTRSGAIPAELEGVYLRTGTQDNGRKAAVASSLLASRKPMPSTAHATHSAHTLPLLPQAPTHTSSLSGTTIGLTATGRCGLA